MLRTLAAACLSAALAVPAAAQDAEARPKNIIVMIADGAGYNMLAATRYWHGRALTADGPAWEKAAMATYALRRDIEPLGLSQNPETVYDSGKNWDAAPVTGASACADGYDAGYAGYEWNRCSAPDSAGTMSAMMTGIRTYNGAINVDGRAEPAKSLAETAKAAGWKVGTLSSVPFTHATVAAGGGAHNRDRDNYHEIASEMLSSETLDFIAGGGNPDYDGDGKVRGENADERYRWISEADWTALKSGESAWALVEDRDAVRDLASAPQTGRLILLPRVASTLQVERTPVGGDGGDPRLQAPGDTPPIETVPTLAELTAAALSQLEGGDGMFLQIEGGAVDWAMHGNFLGRAIEEYIGFNEAVDLVEAWVDDPANGSTWDNTLVVVTADHDHLLFGPGNAPFEPVENRGVGKLPGHKWWSGSHSNQLVPFFIRGAGADRVIAEADQIDSARVNGETVGRGRYLTQPELGEALIGLVSD